MKLADLPAGTYASFYQTYLDVLDPEVTVLGILEKQRKNFPQFLESLPEEKLQYAYDAGKWSIAEALVHVFDTERIFQCRALRIGRGDKTPLPGFDQDAYVPVSVANSWTKSELIEQYQCVRDSTISLYRKFDTDALSQVGTASNGPMSTAALGFIIAGHQRHHRNIIRERYL